MQTKVTEIIDYFEIKIWDELLEIKNFTIGKIKKESYLVPLSWSDILPWSRFDNFNCFLSTLFQFTENFKV